MAGARHVVPLSGGVDPAELFALGGQLGPLSTFAAPTIVKRIVDYAEQAHLSPEAAASAFKTIVYGGAPMYVADLERALRLLGPRFVQIYGQGETPMVATALSRHHLADTGHPRHADRIASVGIAQTPVQVRVADEHGKELPVGAVGEILVKGDSVMAGYWRNDEATAAALRDGWLFTGDLGSLDADGFLTLKDRSKDLIISGGSNIYPREVEEVLLTAPGVAEAAVVGVADSEWGEVVVAFVVPAQGARLAPADLDRHCLTQMARFKRPKRYVLVGDLPKNNYGKVLKTELRTILADSPSSADHPEARMAAREAASVITRPILLDVFGKRMLVERRDGTWRTFQLGSDGKRSLVDFPIPAGLLEAELVQYFDDIYHEAATPLRPAVVRLDRDT